MKKQLKQIQNQAQDGRSMVEMLGVLAIIAILSIGGIIMFRYAMNYYQASQIAHEMNLMRTDAQIKVAQGAEELTLGEPYDTGTIRFNDYPTDFGFTNSIATPENPEEETEEDYYIEVSAIPQGVCNPLATLLNGMDGKTALKVNGNDYDTAVNLCNLEENRLSVSFAAENINDESFAEGWCENDDDCGGGYCQNHICVECKESNDCGEFEVCDQEEGKCTDDCSKGGCQEDLKCDSQTNRCVECRNIDDCSGLACKNNQCATCSSEADCEGKHCTDMGTCVECTGRESIWDANKKECVECNASHPCPSGKICQDGVCGACTTDSQCASNNCQDGACKNCATSADCRDNRACEDGICYDSCKEHASGCGNGTHCDSNTQKCVSNCQSSKECDDLQVCNEETGVCEDDCTAAGAMNCKNGSHCNETSKQCVKDCTPEDCSGETPICDATTHECRACTESDCTAQGKHCKTDGSCVTCSSSTPYWNTTTKQCVQCTENSHCSGTTPICTAGVCGKCTADSQCGTGNHCKTDGSCVTCSDSTPYWNTTTKQCVQCTENSHCSGTTPICDTSTGKATSGTCVQCRTNADCSGDKPYCDTNNGNVCTVVNCPNKTNAECRQKLGDGYYCQSSGCSFVCNGIYYSGTTTEADSCKDGTYKCEKISDYKAENKDIQDRNSPYILSSSNLNWWSAERFCKAQNKNMVKISDLNCNRSLGGTKTGTCYANSGSELSEVIKAIRRAKDGGDGSSGNSYIWLEDPYTTSTTGGSNSCDAYNVYLSDGLVAANHRGNFTFAVCK